MSEGTIQKQIIEYLRSRKHTRVWRMNAGRGRQNQRLAEAGTPDPLVIEPHRTYWIEVKTPEGELSETQREMILFLTECGHEVVVARSLEDVE